MEIDTAFFDGNHAPEIAVEGCFATEDGEVTKEGFAGWETVLGRKTCGPNRRQAWLLKNDGDGGKAITHVRLCMYPDGGIARFRLYGTAVPVFPDSVDEEIELSAAVNGGVAVSASDQHFGVRGNLLLPGRGVDMGDGWETKRSREKGHVDWVVVRLGAKGKVSRVVVDTAHFRGNFPQAVRVDGILSEHGEPGHGVEGWVQVVGEQRCGPDREHVFEVAEEGRGRVFSHLRLVIIPDGGVKRFRVFGTRDV